MKEAIENIRELVKVDTESVPQTSIKVWLDEVAKKYDYLVSELSLAHKRVNELERELSQAIEIIEESGVDYDEIVNQTES